MSFIEKNTKAYTGVVLAGDRRRGDPVALAAGVPCKPFVPIGGRAMVLRVLDVLGEALEIDSLVLCGPSQRLLPEEPELHSLVTSGEINWFQNRETPSSSTYHVLVALSSDGPVLVTTADHALLDATIVDYFCGEARATDFDVVVGLAPHEEVVGAYPQSRRTVTRLRDGSYCSCNLFAFLTPRAREAANFWRRCESNRKKPWSMVSAIGWAAVFGYLLGRLSLTEGLSGISRRINVEVGAVILPFPESAIDVDTVKDWRLVEDIVAKRAM
jgi:GTP:adenosylcobinamide-phosphate guanylyltransferase